MYWVYCLFLTVFALFLLIISTVHSKYLYKIEEISGNAPEFASNEMCVYLVLRNALCTTTIIFVLPHLSM